MSVSSILAFVVAGVAAKNRRADRPEKKRVAELEAKVAELEDAIATANAQARRDQELIDTWRERALSRWVPAVAPPLVQQQHAAAMQQAQAMQQQLLGQQALTAYNNQLAAQNVHNLGAQALGQAMGLLGAQNLIGAELWCNCVPARHDLFLRGE